MQSPPSDQATRGVGRQANVTKQAFRNCGLAENAALPRCERSVTAQLKCHFCQRSAELSTPGQRTLIVERAVQTRVPGQRRPSAYDNVSTAWHLLRRGTLDVSLSPTPTTDVYIEYAGVSR